MAKNFTLSEVTVRLLGETSCLSETSVYLICHPVTLSMIRCKICHQKNLDSERMLVTVTLMLLVA